MQLSACLFVCFVARLLRHSKRVFTDFLASRSGPEKYERVLLWWGGAKFSDPFPSICCCIFSACIMHILSVCV